MKRPEKMDGFREREARGEKLKIERMELSRDGILPLLEMNEERLEWIWE